MRRVVALIAASVLVGSLIASGVSAAPAPREARANSFVGNFDMVEPGSGLVVAHVVAQFQEPTFQRLVPGSLDIYWAPGVATDPYGGTDSGFGARESHGQIVRAAFWGAGTEQPMGGVQGWLCDYVTPQNGSCHPFQMGFGVSAPEDPPTRNVVGFGSYDWCCDGRWYDVGRGKFDLTVVTDTPGFPWGPPPAPPVGSSTTATSGLSGGMSAPTSRTAAESSFVGDFDLLDYGSPPRRVAHVTARFGVPSVQKLVPGTLDISWAPNLEDTGLGWPPVGIRESHAKLVRTWFSPGSDGFTHARVQGVLCDYLGPQVASCHPFQMDFAANDDPTLPDEVGFGPYETCCPGPYYIAGKGAFKLDYAPTEGPSAPHVGASFMTFWGLEPSGADGTPPWSLPRSDSPLLGQYSSADPKVAERQIATATSHGVNLFFMDFGWIQPGDPLDVAAHTGLMSARNVDQIDLAVMYFPDAVVPPWGQGPDRLRSDFAYLDAAYFSHPSYLRTDGRPVVIVNNLPWYWWEFGVDGTNALFAEVKEQYGLYLIGGVWPDTNPDDVQGSPFDALTIWGNIWSSLGNDPDQTYTYADYADAYRGYFGQWHDLAVSNGLQFVPSVYPGFDNLTYTSPAYGQPHLVIERDLGGFASLTQYARAMATDPLDLTLFFSWNDFSEGHAIEPSVNYGDTYLKTIASTFAK